MGQWGGTLRARPCGDTRRVAGGTGHFEMDFTIAACTTQPTSPRRRRSSEARRQIPVRGAGGCPLSKGIQRAQHQPTHGLLRAAVVPQQPFCRPPVLQAALGSAQALVREFAPGTDPITVRPQRSSVRLCRLNNFLELGDVPNEVLAISASKLGIGDCDHVIVNEKVDIR